MKKIFVLLLLLFTVTFSYSQEIAKFRTTEAAFKLNEEWSDWISTRINIIFDFTNDKIIIYSKDIQVYKVLEELDPPYDATGRQIAFQVIDQDFAYGIIRLRIENNGNSQIYIDFKDISIVYNVKRTN